MRAKSEIGAIQGLKKKPYLLNRGFIPLNGFITTMAISPTSTVLLDNFEGPLDLLLYLTHHKEIDIYDIPLHEITSQFLKTFAPEFGIDTGAEFLATTASLMLIKSKMLLPGDVHDKDDETIEDPRVEILHHLIEYCKFKQLGKELSAKEEVRSQFFYRGFDRDETPEQEERNLLKDVSLGDLSEILNEALQRADSRKHTIQEEVWRVSDKIRWLKNLSPSKPTLSILDLFPPKQSRNESIITFLALLEMMKQEQFWLEKDAITGALMLHRTKQSEGQNDQ